MLPIVTIFEVPSAPTLFDLGLPVVVLGRDGTRGDEGRIKMAGEFKAKVGFLGGGNMAKAMAKGFIKSKTVNPANIIVSATTKKTLSLWKVMLIKA